VTNVIGEFDDIVAPARVESGRGLSERQGPTEETPELANAAAYDNKRGRKVGREEVLRENPPDADRGTDRNPALAAQPIGELSPEAFERQRPVEEADAVAARRREAEASAKQEEFEARPKGPTDGEAPPSRVSEQARSADGQPQRSKRPETKSSEAELGKAAPEEEEI
jgi:hypothetical protein